MSELKDESLRRVEVIADLPPSEKDLDIIVTLETLCLHNFYNEGSGNFFLLNYRKTLQ